MQAANFELGGTLATVRIYKVAEVLNITSQEVVALLKADHGIEVKSASSTIEEVVARSFVERQARQRNIPLPSVAQMFADAPAAKARKGKAAEPPKPAQAPLPPPRLIKVVHRPAPVEPAEGEVPSGEASAGEAPAEAPAAAAPAPAAAETAAPPRPRIVPPRATGIRLEENQGVTPPPAEPIEIETAPAPAVEEAPAAAPAAAAEAAPAEAAERAAPIAAEEAPAAPRPPAEPVPAPRPRRRHRARRRGRRAPARRDLGLAPPPRAGYRPAAPGVPSRRNRLVAS